MSERERAELIAQLEKALLYDDGGLGYRRTIHVTPAALKLILATLRTRGQGPDAVQGWPSEERIAQVLRGPIPPGKGDYCTTYARAILALFPAAPTPAGKEGDA